MKSKAHGKRCPEGTAPGPVLSEPETEEGGACKNHFTPSVPISWQTSKDRSKGNSAVILVCRWC